MWCKIRQQLESNFLKSNWIFSQIYLLIYIYIYIYIDRERERERERERLSIKKIE